MKSTSLSALPEVERRLADSGVTGAGRDWLIKALDPSSSGPCPGIPDTCATDVVRPEYRVQSTINGPPTATQWDLFMWLPPGDVNSLVWAAGPSPADFTVLVQGVAPPLFGWTYGTIPLQPVIDLPGTFSGLSLTAVGTGAAGPWQLRVPASRAQTFRHMYKSVTLELSAPDVNNQGDVYAAQFASRCVSSSFDQTGVLSTTVPSAPLGAISDYFRLPLTEGDLTLACPNAYVGRAKNGVYMPLRHGGPTIDFADVNVKWPLTVQGGGRMFFVTDVSDEANQMPHLPQITAWDGAGALTTSSPYAVNTALQQYSTTGTWAGIVQNSPGCDTGYDNMNCGVVIWRGLAGPAASGIPFGATVLVKVLAGHEFIPRPSSVDRIYAKPSTPYDPRAIAAYYGIAMGLAPAYPASFNSFGDILNVIRNVASKVLTPIKAIAAPVLSIANGVGRFLGIDDNPSRPESQATPVTIQMPAQQVARAPRKLVVKTKRKIR
jgi:hypothetical protein